MCGQLIITQPPGPLPLFCEPVPNEGLVSPRAPQNISYPSNYRLPLEASAEAQTLCSLQSPRTSTSHLFSHTNPLHSSSFPLLPPKSYSRRILGLAFWPKRATLFCNSFMDSATSALFLTSSFWTLPRRETQMHLLQ